jgi:hypothetical protein
MLPLQKTFPQKWVKVLAWTFAQLCSGDFLVPYFAMLYWVLDQEKCVHGIWLVPTCEITNGMLKWLFHVPRPSWVDKRLNLDTGSHEFSFPSSHAQMIFALATFFVGTSHGQLREVCGVECVCVQYVHVYDFCAGHFFRGHESWERCVV